MADIVRKFVKPAHPAATIPDPDHSDMLPPDGREVVWTPYWILMANRQEIEVSEIASLRPMLKSSDTGPKPAA